MSVMTTTFFEFNFVSHVDASTRQLTSDVNNTLELIIQDLVMSTAVDINGPLSTARRTCFFLVIRSDYES